MNFINFVFLIDEYKLGGLIMVSNYTISGMVISILISVLFPIGLLIYFRKKYIISYKVVGVGVLTWIVFSQILEKIMHVIVLRTTNIMAFPLIFTIYGALAAGIFEEVGRYISYKIFLKGKTEWKDGIAFGIGHGGIEAIFIGLISTLQYIVFSVMINSGTFATLSSKIPASSLSQIKSSLLQGTLMTASIGGIERVFAIILQIFFSLVVLYGVKHNKKVYLLIAILAHTFMDVFAGLYQVHVITNIFIVEAIVMSFAVVAIILIKKFKSQFSKIY